MTQAFQAEVARIELVLAAEEALLRVGGLLAQLVGGFVAEQSRWPRAARISGPR